MTAILEPVVPLFRVIFLGVFAARAGFLGEAGIRGLGAFVFDFAIAPHVFRLMAETELDQITEWGFLGGYFLAQATVFVTGAAIGTARRSASSRALLVTTAGRSPAKQVSMRLGGRRCLHSMSRSATRCGSARP